MQSEAKKCVVYGDCDDVAAGWHQSTVVITSFSVGCRKKLSREKSKLLFDIIL